MSVETTRQPRIVNIDMRCCCGAQLFIEWPLECGYVTRVVEISNAFIVAHGNKCHALAKEQKP